jgi:hypothetical protein
MASSPGAMNRAMCNRVKAIRGKTALRRNQRLPSKSLNPAVPCLAVRFRAVPFLVGPCLAVACLAIPCLVVACRVAGR